MLSFRKCEGVEMRCQWNCGRHAKMNSSRKGAILLWMMSPLLHCKTTMSRLNLPSCRLLTSWKVGFSRRVMKLLDISHAWYWRCRFAPQECRVPMNSNSWSLSKLRGKLWADRRTLPLMTWSRLELFLSACVLWKISTSRFQDLIQSSSLNLYFLFL